MIVKWKHQKRYGQEPSYIKGMAWLDVCAKVEDWGCAKAYAKRYCEAEYVGVDGTPGAADVVADLSTYRSKTPGLFMRHVLEHNYDWEQILQNALSSFTQRMSLIFYRPLKDKQKVIIPKNPVELDLPRPKLRKMVDEVFVREEFVKPSVHGFETIWYLEKGEKMPWLD